MEMPKFELIAGEIVNLNSIDRIYTGERPQNVSSTDKKSKEEPVYTITVELSPESTLVLGYKAQVDRDMKFNALCQALGIQK